MLPDQQTPRRPGLGRRRFLAALAGGRFAAAAPTRLRHGGFDIDQDLAIRNRTRLLDRAATDRLLMLGYHWAGPGLGHAVARGQGFHFAPIA